MAAASGNAGAEPAVSDRHRGGDAFLVLSRRILDFELAVVPTLRTAAQHPPDASDAGRDSGYAHSMTEEHRQADNKQETAGPGEIEVEREHEEATRNDADDERNSYVDRRRRIKVKFEKARH